MATEKIKYICDVPCPSCGNIVIIKKKIKIIAPAEPADKEEEYYAEKGTQLTLDASTQDGNK